MNKHGLSVAAALFGATAFVIPARGEILVGIPDVFSGPAGWGFQVQRAVEVAVDELNEAGGVLGEHIRTIWVDDFCDADQAVAAARKLVSDGVVFAIGHSCSHTAIATSEVYEEAGVLLVANGSNPRVTDEGGASVFRLNGRDDQVAAVTADYLVERWADERIAIIHDGRIYGKYLADTVKQLLHEQGVKEAVSDEVTAGQLEFLQLVAKLQAEDIDVVFFAAYTQEVSLFIRQARDRGADFVLIGSDSVTDEEFSFVAGPATEGTLATEDSPPTNAAAAARFVARYREKYPTLPGKLADMSPRNYVALQVWAEAVEIAGTFEAEAVAQVLHTHKFDTMYGEISFDEKGDITGFETWSWVMWENEELIPMDPKDLPPTD